MAQGVGERTAGDVLTGLGAAVDAAFAAATGPLPGLEQLELLRAGLRLEGRLHALLVQLAGRVDAAEVTWRVHGTSTATWLADAVNLTRGEAGRLVSAGLAVRRFPLVGEAAADGAVLPGQAEAIAAVLDDLPTDFPSGVVTEAQEMMVGFAATHTSVELRRLAAHLVGVLAPDTAEAREGARLEREHRTALRHRHLVFTDDHHGSVLLRGSLPVAEAEPLRRIVDSYAANLRRGLERIDPDAEPVSPAMRRADALLAMADRHAQEALAPSHGGDRPRIVVTMSYDKLMKQCLDARLAGDGQRIPASMARVLLCDADVLPAVLGGGSEVLDLGRARRLVSPAIRAALDVRDRGCVFPGCETPPRDCHAHHLQPWWAGGRTAVSNLVLVCAHHHGIIEPGHDPAADRWRARLGADGVPQIIPPRRVDPDQRPRLHTRFQHPLRR